VGRGPAVDEELAALVPAAVRQQPLRQLEPGLEPEQAATRLGQGDRSRNGATAACLATLAAYASARAGWTPVVGMTPLVGQASSVPIELTCREVAQLVTGDPAAPRSRTGPDRLAGRFGMPGRVT
jgi:hypothetical protein